MCIRSTSLLLLLMLSLGLPGAALAQDDQVSFPCPELCSSATDGGACVEACSNLLLAACERPAEQSCDAACAASCPGFCSTALAQMAPEQCSQDCRQACTGSCNASCGELTAGFDNPAKTAADMLEEIEDARWKLTPGFELDTGLSLSATSRVARAFDLGEIAIDNPWCAFAVFDGKGEWSSATDAKNHAEAALAPTIAYCRPRVSREEGTPLFEVPLAVGLTVDLRSRWGTFEEGEGDQKKTVEGNQTVAGAGLTLLLPSTPAWLKGFELTGTYYQVVDSDGDLSAPEELDIDHLQARLKSRILPFVGSKRFSALALVLDGRASQALDGPDEGDFEYYTSLALEVGSKKTAATVRWESGKEVGFEYDEKIVLGILLRLLGVETGGS